MGIIILLIGIALFAYSRVIGIYDSTVKAMGSVVLKTIAGWGGGIAILLGILLILAR